MTVALEAPLVVPLCPLPAQSEAPKPAARRVPLDLGSGRCCVGFDRWRAKRHWSAGRVGIGERKGERIGLEQRHQHSAIRLFVGLRFAHTIA
jgi:hypothetical protein